MALTHDEEESPNSIKKVCTKSGTLAQGTVGTPRDENGFRCPGIL